VPDPTIHPRALPSDLPAEGLHRRRDAQGSVGVGPETAGWRYLDFTGREVPPGGTRIEVREGRPELCLVVLAGRDVGVTAEDGTSWVLAGRESAFDDLPSALWLPRSSSLTVTVGRPPANGPAAIAWATAPRSERDGVGAEPILITPDDIVVETRGAGNATRQISHIIAPSFPADRLELVEVYTPSGNWSSWPPHKHDVDDMPGEAVLEEIYHYQFRRPEAWAIQRVYRADRSRDAIFEVRHGDVVFVPDGYHPFTATHGDDAYYLNALAGDRRTMACSFDPDLDWVRATWDGMELDPRVPLVPARTAG
jgi:5-deoxy-glucuronate isomerase